MTVLWTIIALTVLGALFAVLLYVVAKKFEVKEDTRIAEIEALLPGANCGGCGHPGCHGMAVACVKDMDIEKNFCPVGGNDTMEKVGAILGLAAVHKDPEVAVVRCNGSCQARPKVNSFDGASSCRVMATLYSGDTLCSWGCVGCGDCVKVCTNSALSIDSTTGLPVVDESLCGGCGQCAKVCPKGVIEIRPKGPRGMKVVVECVNKDKGAVARKACANACIGCGKCAKACPHEAITLDNNVAHIDWTKCKLCKKCVAECPTGAIHAMNFPVLKKKEETSQAAN